MSRAVELLCSRRVPQLAVLALMSFAFAGCSADMQSRLSQTSNPFGPQEATGSVPPRDVPAYSRPQPYQSQSYQPQAYPQQQPYQPPQPYQSSALPPISAPQSYAAAQPATYAPKEHTPPASVGVTGGGRGVASYSPPAYSPPAYTAPSRPPLEATASIAPRSVAAARTPTPTSTKIIVGTSDTLEILAHRYNVPAAAIMQANNLKGPRALSPGQQLIIPHSASAVAAATPALAPPASKPVAVAAVAPNTHVVGHGDTLLSIARRNHVSLPDLARANNLNPSSKLSLGEKIVVPASRVAAATPAATPVAVQPLAAAPVPQVTKFAAAETPQKARLAQATPNAEEPAVESPVKAAESTGAVPTFRWPVRGKVITAYGAKANGKANDGINLAVPEGTPVKAADDGVVAYSGNELKGYGNLVLIRHANGYVTAYAHASELMVKRGDTIKRGQVIAKSGQSGEVQSPQLHFEIRKGSSPVDPLQFLNGA
jgi:murein DD-endopeptidase MepM/ murein hydrolase activator NlpD